MAVLLDQFVKLLEDSGILAGDTLQDFLPPKREPKSAEELALELVRQKKLTKFQAEEVSKGKGKSLTLGNYVLLEKIGAGGMGQVFKARHRRMDRLVAVKLLPAAMTKNKEAIARFEREVQAAARLRHTNIVAADDADQANGVHFLVMELVEGIDLSALIKRNGPVSIEKAVYCILQAAKGLEFAHKKGVIHRDIKPANLLLDTEGTIKILDMGLARIHGESGPQAELTATGAVMGTVDYMAPEQALSTKTADARADIYSLGCSLFYLLTGKATYDGETLMAKLLAHRDQPIPDLRAVCPEVPNELDAIFKQMVAKKVEDRYQTMTDVIAALESYGSGQSSSQSSQPAGTGQKSSVGARPDAPPAMAMPADIAADENQTSEFDPYRKWFGIPPGEQPPNHYRLLGIDLYESDPDVIEVAADKQMAYLTSCAHGPQMALSQRLLNEISAARVCLLNAGKKAAYDAQLKAHLSSRKAQLPEGETAAAVSPLTTKKEAAVKSKVTSPAPLVESSADEDEFSPTPAKSNRTRNLPRRPGKKGKYKLNQDQKKLLQIGGAVLGVVILLAGVILSFRTKDGKLIVTVNEPDAAVEVLNEEGKVEITRQGEKGPITISVDPGKHRLKVQKNGFELFATEFEITKRGETSITAKLVPVKESPEDEATAKQGSVRDVTAPMPSVVYLDDLKEADWKDGHLQLGKHNREFNGWKYTWRGKEPAHALSTHPLPNRTASVSYRLDGQYETLSATTGIADVIETRSQNPLVFRVVGDGRELWKSPPLQKVADEATVEVSVKGIRELRLEISCGNNNYKAHAIWFEPRLTCAGNSTSPTARVPSPAVAPFDAAQAKKHQEEWAAYLKLPVEYTNSLGMKFALVPPGEFMMGTGPSETEVARKTMAYGQEHLPSMIAREQPQHRVVITRPFLLSATEVTVGAFKKFAADTGYRTEAEKGAKDAKAKTYLNPGSWNDDLADATDDMPVTYISWNDAVACCQWLSQQEKAAYRLPTEAEWEYACRAGTTGQYFYGDESKGISEYGWYKDNVKPNGTLGPAGKKPPNPFGLHDVCGNVWEWCQDFFDVKWYEKSPLNDPVGPDSGPYRVLRGGYQSYNGFTWRSAYREGDVPTSSSGSTFWRGFRVVRVLDAPATTASDTPPPTGAPPAESGSVAGKGSPPPLAKARFDAAQAKAHQEAWARYLGTTVQSKNSVGMSLLLIPPGEFLMSGQKPVALTAPYRMGATEVTIAQFKKFAAAKGYKTDAETAGEPATYLKPGYPVTDECPAAFVSREDAKAYCLWLSDVEKATYRLPTAAQWEFACRAGTTGKYSFGDDVSELGNYAWWSNNSGNCSHPVGTKLPNPFGLYDMHGNVEEFSSDGARPGFHGGGFNVNRPDKFESSSVEGYGLTPRLFSVGFRCVQQMDAIADSRHAMETATAQPDKPWNTPAFQAWVKEVQAMPAEQQVEAVSKKLMKLNPEFDGKVTPKVEKGLVTEMKFMTDTVTDISPVRALSGVMTLACQGSKFNGILADVSPLQGMPLTTLSLAGNPKLSEISPLRGMPLSSLDIYSCIPVTDIEPLKGMQLMFLSLGGTQTRDLTPLKGMRLKTLNLLDCPLRDLSPLIGMPLEDLYFFSRSNTKVTDLSPLKQLPLKKLVIDFQPERDIEILRSIKTLEKINEKPAAEFWKEVEEKQSAKKP